MKPAEKGKRFAVIDRLAPLVFLVVLSVALSFASGSFATQNNVLSMIQQSAVIIVIAIGQTILMISGGIDLSVGAVLALSVIVAAVVHRSGGAPALGVIAALLTASICGLINGLVVTKARVPAFIATLGMMGMARGLALVLSDSVNMDVPPFYGPLGAHTAFYAAVVLVVSIVAYIVLSRTRYGRQCYAVGGNMEASRLSGVAVDKHMIKSFVTTGLIVGIASILMMARTAIASPTSGEGYELDSIAGAVIGGTSMFGGVGSIGGSIVGSLIMIVLRNGCDQLNVTISWQQFVIGAMIILAVFYDGVRRRSRG